jgi:CBS domain-containing protein
MNLEQHLKKEQVVHLDLHNFTSVESGTSARATIEKMRQEEQHCAIIFDNDVLVGIFTDRDILRKVVDTPETLDNPIDDLMTPSPITVSSQDPADSALDLMDKKHFRNVPVLDDDGKIMGNLTPYAIIKYLADRFPASVYNLPPDPDRVTKNRDGA